MASLLIERSDLDAVLRLLSNAAGMSSFGGNVVGSAWVREASALLAASVREKCKATDCANPSDDDGSLGYCSACVAKPFDLEADKAWVDDYRASHEPGGAERLIASYEPAPLPRSRWGRRRAS